MDDERSSNPPTDEEMHREHEIAHDNWVKLVALHAAREHAPDFLKDFAEAELIHRMLSLSRVEAISILTVALEFATEHIAEALLVEIRLGDSNMDEGSSS
jgi:hypothetical protein